MVFSLPYRIDRNRNGGGVMIFVKEDIPSKLLTKHNFPTDVEGFLIELNFRKSKRLLFGTYQSPAQNDQYFFNCYLILTVALGTYSSYDNVLHAEDFNAEDHLTKEKPCQILYRDYKKINYGSFNEDLQNHLCTTQINTCTQFENTFLCVLNMHGPLKKSY